MVCRGLRQHRNYKFPAELSNLGAEAKKAELEINQDRKSAGKDPGKNKERDPRAP